MTLPACQPVSYRGDHVMFSESEQRVLRTFRQFLMTPDRMLCFSGTHLKQSRVGLDRLIHKELLVKEKFRGAYSLTEAGFEAMMCCK